MTHWIRGTCDGPSGSVPRRLLGGIIRYEALVREMGYAVLDVEGNDPLPVMPAL